MPRTLGHLWEGGAGQRHFSAMDTSLTTQAAPNPGPWSGLLPLHFQDHGAHLRFQDNGQNPQAHHDRQLFALQNHGPSRDFWRLLSRLDHRQPPLWLRTRENYQGFRAPWTAPPESQRHSPLPLRFGSGPRAAPCQVGAVGMPPLVLLCFQLFTFKARSPF